MGRGKLAIIKDLKIKFLHARHNKWKYSALHMLKVRTEWADYSFNPQNVSKYVSPPAQGLRLRPLKLFGDATQSVLFF